MMSAVRALALIIIAGAAAAQTVPDGVLGGPIGGTPAPVTAQHARGRHAHDRALDVHAFELELRVIEGLPRSGRNCSMAPATYRQATSNGLRAPRHAALGLRLAIVDSGPQEVTHTGW
jgi:hypothetical protein